MSKSKEELEQMGRWQTPRSDRLRAGYGSLLMSPQIIKGLCDKGRRCFKKADHSGDCYPKD